MWQGVCSQTSATSFSPSGVARYPVRNATHTSSRAGRRTSRPVRVHRARAARPCHGVVSDSGNNHLADSVRGWVIW